MPFPIYGLLETNYPVQFRSHFDWNGPTAKAADPVQEVLVEQCRPASVALFRGSTIGVIDLHARMLSSDPSNLSTTRARVRCPGELLVYYDGACEDPISVQLHDLPPIAIATSVYLRNVTLVNLEYARAVDRTIGRRYLLPSLRAFPAFKSRPSEYTGRPPGEYAMLDCALDTVYPCPLLSRQYFRWRRHLSQSAQRARQNPALCTVSVSGPSPHLLRSAALARVPMLWGRPGEKPPLIGRSRRERGGDAGILHLRSEQEFWNAVESRDI
ncbi:hypothetical protein FB451DRAFT_1187593 [Mycena latifolia]|nr:hypothetical protein FB451DRAFT_1187593 [Mycena latifolia]